MIVDELQQFVERNFSDPFGDDDGQTAVFREKILKALELGHSLRFLGEAHGCGAGEMLALKKIQEAHRTGIVPKEV